MGKRILVNSSIGFKMITEEKHISEMNIRVYPGEHNCLDNSLYAVIISDDSIFEGL